MCVLIFDDGILTASWYAELALRRRVNMSAIGSVIDIAWPFGLSRRGIRPLVEQRTYGVADLPGRFGDAGQLAGVCHLPDADPAETEDAVDSARTPAARAASVAADLELRLPPGLGDHGLRCHLSGLLEGEAESAQERASLVVGLGRGHDRDVHAARPVDAVRVDLVEHRLLVETERVVAVAVELGCVKAAEVTDTGQRDREQPVEELPHPVPAQRHVRPDRHALAQLELRDRLARLGHGRLLAGDEGQVPNGAFDQLAVTSRLADAHVDLDLHQRGDLHHVGVAELLAQGRNDLVAIALLEPGDRALWSRCCRHVCMPSALRCPRRTCGRRGPSVLLRSCGDRSGLAWSSWGTRPARCSRAPLLPGSRCRRSARHASWSSPWCASSPG